MTPDGDGASAICCRTVAAADIDHMGHVNNSVYLNWIERAVLDHWASLATPQEHAAFLWIAVRHELDYRQPAFVGETVMVALRITEVRRARAWYDTIISRDGRPLVEVRSCWACVDAASRRLTVIPREVTARFLPAR